MRSMGGDDLHLDTQDVGFHEERIVVSVRMRPLNSKEILRNDPIDWNCVDENTIIYKNSGPERSNFPNGYTFDRVFQCNCPTKQVYEEAAKKVALSVVSGINASIFAYGQTSSGKTYTMSGVTSYTVEDIYEYINKHTEREFVLKFSAMEIYNEAVRDLLSADGTPLRLLDDPERGTVVDRLTEETLEDLDHLKELLSVCEAQRQIGETSLNEASSRSHQILRLTIESSTREFVGKGNSSTLAASVDFVDLAGSERASQALSAGTRLKEGCHINRSLLTLGTVIRKLSKGRGGHVPYRDSKLTRILQCSLGGNARTAIICTISPARSHVEQSRNTLQFASCAKEVATNAQVNVVMSDKILVKQLQRELAKLESELKGAGKPSSTSVPAEIIKEKDLRIEKLENEIKELIRQRDSAQSRLEDLVQVGADDQASGQWEHYDQTLRLRAPLTLSDDDLTSESSGLADRHCLDVGHVGLRTLSSCHSRCSEGNYDDPYLHLPETPVDQFLSDGISPRFSSSHTRFLEADPEEIVRGKMVRRGNEENSGEICKVVRCVEIEKYSTRETFDSEEMPAVTSTGHGDATDKPLPSPPHKGDRELREVPPEFGLKQALFLSAENGDKFRNVHADSGNNDLSPQEGDNGLGQIPTKVGFGQALFLSPEKGDKELREVQTEYGVDHGSPFSPQKDNKESREVQIKCGADQASFLSPQRTDVEINSVQIEYHVDEALPLSPKKGDKEYAADQALSLSAENKDNESMEIQTEYGVLEMKLQGVQNTTDSLVDPLPNEPSEDTSSPNSLKLTKSRSCRESLVTRSADASPSKEYEKQFPGARMSFQGKISSLHFSPNSSKFSREDSISSEQSVSFDESKGHKSGNSSRFSREDSFTSELRSFPRRDMININSSISGLIRNAPELMGLREMDRLSCAKQGLDYLLEKVSSSSSDTEKSIRYIGLETVEDNRGMYPVDDHTDGNPVGDHKESPSRWPAEFRRQQREIIDLWETCKVSLVHRTYFFLLFKGDPSDSIYMEVERRRLSFLGDRMAQGNSGKFFMNGVPDITPASSIRALRRERDMLCKQMNKRLTEEERISLYQKWGIEVNSKQRRQQLARKLWADTEDMDLIMESASLVAKLVGLIEPGQALKEMFSLSFSFTPQKMHRRSISWKNGMSSFL